MSTAGPVVPGQARRIAMLIVILAPALCPILGGCDDSPAMMRPGCCERVAVPVEDLGRPPAPQPRGPSCCIAGELPAFPSEIAAAPQVGFLEAAPLERETGRPRPERAAAIVDTASPAHPVALYTLHASLLI